MNFSKARIIVSAVAVAVTLAVAGGYRALAQQSPQRVAKTVDQRVADLESKVLSLQLKVRALESTVSRVPKLGVQDVGR